MSNLINPPRLAAGSPDERNSNFKYIVIGSILLATILAVTSCDDDECNCPNPPTCEVTPSMTQSEIQEILINNTCNTVRFSAGVFNLSSTLSVDGRTNFKIVGAGKGQTVLSFAEQSGGSDGLFVTNAKNFTIENLTVLDTKGDAVKVKDSDGVTFRNVETIWSAERSPSNGGYGIYPVLCSNVLIEGCYARGASDAGIYVGQSTNAIIRDSKAEGNVMGIQVENTINADVYNNEVRDNAGGILAFDLQGLTQYGSHTRIFGNLVIDNNGDNFAVEGGFAALAPAGTGILLMATRDAEVFGNTIDGNNVVGLGVITFVTVSILAEISITDPNYDAFFERIYVHDNEFRKSENLNTGPGQTKIGMLLLGQFGGYPIPDIVVDGIFKPDAGENGGLCLDDNIDAGFVNLDISGWFANPSFDPTAHVCSGAVLPPVTRSE
ncbi:MAG TPA: parallel beta-helix domain-containing protein [Cyclobacteriaceae bacterium]|jgi:parallel beta-helix repeat protein